jgi:nitroimidazol reductase NimA-like FMN-containing flavoprotein (pyridoxamine 5'-phosphate oxidase superfamily)
MSSDATTLEPTTRTTLTRLPERGSHQRAKIHEILDAGAVCQIGYQMDGSPRVLPTVYWRTGEAVYWHGSRESRALLAMTGQEVCFTVTLLDGLVLARSAFHHSANYRAVMAFGRAESIEDEVEKLAAYREMFDRLYPGRWADIRRPSRAELWSTMVMRLELTEASAKVRAMGPVDSKPDLRQPAWAGVIPMTLTAGAPVEADDLRPGGVGLQIPDWLPR